MAEELLFGILMNAPPVFIPLTKSESALITSARFDELLLYLPMYYARARALASARLHQVSLGRTMRGVQLSTLMRRGNLPGYRRRLVVSTCSMRIAPIFAPLEPPTKIWHNPENPYPDQPVEILAADLRRVILSRGT